MSNHESETEALYPPPYDESEAAVEPTKPHRDPLYLFIFYGLSLVASVVGLVYALKGWYIARTAPFDETNKRMEIDSYERDFWKMQSIYSILSINILWTGMNLYFLMCGKGKHIDLAPLNSAYDLLIWAALIAFGVVNLLIALWDRRLCDGWARDKEAYDKCDVAQFKLLVVEIVAVSLGMLVAVIHFILLIARCCTLGRLKDERRVVWLRLRIVEEELVLRQLLARRRVLEDESTERERALPALPNEESRLRVREERVNGVDDGDDLIDIEEEFSA